MQQRVGCLDETDLRNTLSFNIKRYRERKGWVSPFSLVKLASSLEIEVFEFFKPQEKISEEILDLVSKSIDDFSTSLKVSFDKALLDSRKKALRNL